MSFAFLTDYYMRTHGARPEDFAKICIAQRQNASSFPHALFKKPLTLDEYLTARPIALDAATLPHPSQGARKIQREIEKVPEFARP